MSSHNQILYWILRLRSLINQIMQLSEWYVLGILLYCLETNYAAQSRLLQCSVMENRIIPHSTLDKWLSLPTEDVPHLKLLLRNDLMRQDAENTYTEWFLERNQFLLTVTSFNVSMKSRNDHTSCRDSYVIVTCLEQLRETFQRFLQRAGVFFFILTNSEINMELLRDILQEAWVNLSVFNIYILTMERGILIFDPFEYESQQMRYGQIRSYFGDQRLERLLFQDMRGYPMRVQIFKSVYARPQFNNATGKIESVFGVDGEVARLLAKHMNFTLLLQDPDPDYFGERNINGTYNGAIGSIINNDIDICLTGFFVKDYMVPEMEFTIAVYDDQLCIYVPKASRVPQSILPIYAVTYNLWASFILTAFVCITVWWLFRLLNLWLNIKAIEQTKSRLLLARKTQWFQFIRIFIDTWVVWVRVNIVRYPPFHSERIFLASLCLVSVIFGAIFESSLATVYIHPMYYKDINTLHELDDSGLKIIYKYSSMADDLFFSDTSLLFANLNKKLTHLNNLNADVILDVSQNGGKAGVTRYTSLMLESLHFIVSKRVWVVPECPKYYTISYVLPKDSPWQKGINDLLLRFLSAGLIEKWIGDQQAQVNRQIMKENLFETVDSFKVLTVADLQLAFYVVIMGSFLAIVCFIFENIFQRIFGC